MAGNLSAVSAKIKAMHSGFLKEDDYQEMLNKSSVKEICYFLRDNTSYHDSFLNVSDEKLHRGDIEKNILNHAFFDQYIRLYNFMSKKGRDMLRLWFYQTEVAFLKHRCRYILNGESFDSEFGNKNDGIFFEEHTKIDCKVAMDARSLFELANACENTEFYDIIKTADKNGSDYFSVSMMLEKLFFSLLWREKDKLSKDEAGYIKELFGPVIDMQNIMWIYRSKKYYNLNENMIYTLIIPIKYRLRAEEIKAMVSSEGVSAIENYVKNSPYKSLFDGINDGNFMEEKFSRIALQISKKVFVTHSRTISEVFAYFRLKQAEIHNITTIIEGVRYQMAPELIKKHIII